MLHPGWCVGGLQGSCFGAAGAKEALPALCFQAGLGWRMPGGEWEAFPALYSGNRFLLFEVVSLGISAHLELLPWAMHRLGVD